jgi:hypothetical protein
MIRRRIYSVAVDVLAVVGVKQSDTEVARTR